MQSSDEIGHLQNKLKVLYAELSDKTEECKLQKTQLDNLSKKIEHLNENYGCRLSELSNELDGMKKHVQNLATLHEIKQRDSAKEVAELKKHLNEEVNERGHVQHELDKVKTELDKVKGELKLKEYEINWRQESLDSIHNSKLYKYLCAPVWSAHDKLLPEKGKQKRADATSSNNKD